MSSVFDAHIKSFICNPLILWDHHVIVTFPHSNRISGWWSSFSARFAILLAKSTDCWSNYTGKKTNWIWKEICGGKRSSSRSLGWLSINTKQIRILAREVEPTTRSITLSDAAGCLDKSPFSALNWRVFWHLLEI